MLEKIIGILGTWASLFGAAIGILLAIGIQLTYWILALAASVPAILLFSLIFFGKKSLFLTRIGLLYHRAYLTLSGASKLAFMVDTMRIIGLFALGFIALNQHGMRLFAFHFGLLFLLSLTFLYIHSLIYPFLQKQTIWDKSYKSRKAMETIAITFAAKSASNGNYSPNTIRNIEINAMKAIKSYIEFKVWDRDGININVNLLVVHPKDPSRIVCIQRISTGVPNPIPTYYEITDMPETQEAIETGNPIYVARFSKPGKAYKMVWKIPIKSPHSNNSDCIGILSVNSLKPRHLDFVDDRESLLYNLSPYIALLTYSLLIRQKYDIWHELVD